MALTTIPASLSATALTLTTAAQPNITSVGTLTGLTVSGNIAGTLTTAAQTNITSVGTLTGLNLSGNVFSGNKTGLTDTNTGHAIAPGGLVYHTTDGTLTQSLNRLTDDGPVLRLVGQNTTAGSIGVLSGGLSFGSGSSMTTRMIIDSSGKVGIGGTPGSGNLLNVFPNSGNLAVKAGRLDSTNNVRLEAGGTTSTYLEYRGYLGHIWDVDTTERMRIDSSGNLLVGAITATNLSDGTGNDGVHLNPSGTVAAARTSNVTAVFNRLSSHGQIIRFNKDGASVGAIGSSGGDLVIHSTASGHEGLHFGNGAIVPTDNTGATNDGAVNLGGATMRFLDLYLSGVTRVGGVEVSNGDVNIKSLDTSVNDGESLGALNFISSDASTGGAGTRANIQAIGSDYGTKYGLAFGTGAGAAPTEKMRIDPDGKVGINVEKNGNSAPQKTLHVEHTAGASEGILISGSSDTIGHTAGILLRAEGGEQDSALRAKGGIFFERTGTYGVGKLILANDTGGDNTSATVSDGRFFINQNGVIQLNNQTEIADEKVNIQGPVINRASNNAGYGIYENSFTTSITSSTSKYIRIQQTGNLQGSMEVTLTANYGNVNAGGFYRKGYMVMCNAISTAIYNSGTSTSDLVNLGATSGIFTLSALTKPNNTTIYVPLSSNSSYTIVLFIHVKILGEINGISSVDLISQ